MSHKKESYVKRCVSDQILSRSNFLNTCLTEKMFQVEVVAVGVMNQLWQNQRVYPHFLYFVYK